MTQIRHLEMDELLALRDGEGSEFALVHVEACDRCRAELERLHQTRAQLRALRSTSPPRDLWPRVASDVRARRARRRFGVGFAALAAAATLAGVFVLRGPAAVEVPAITVAEPSEGPRDIWIAESESGDLGPMITRSQQLETLLRVYAPRQQVYDAPTALSVSVLEDRIRLLDQALLEGRAVGADRELLRGLWSDRVQALETLVGLQLVQQEDQVWR